jgi:nitrogen-specific signal transduction histidine kinase
MILSLDITERKALEVQLRHSQKMEAVGRLAGGVAHDFNNILTIISSLSRFVLETLPPADQAHTDMTEILEAVRRAEGLVGQLLAFSRQRPIDPRVVGINEIVTSVQKMLRRIVGENIDITTRLDAGTWNVRIDPGAFEQVLMNLAVNARDAMSHGGKLTIETANVVLDEHYQMTKGGAVIPGEYVVLAFSDDGMGMDDTTKQRLFEPFFTTKEPGRGTGLGLSTCYGIVKQAAGYIWVYSEKGKGTTFKIYLPRSHETRTRSTFVARQPASVGTETILVVEDDPQVRALAVRSLRRYGYSVLEAQSAGDALLMSEGSQTIDLLLTDVIMPRINGKALAARVTEHRPNLRVLYMSGYTENVIVHHGILDAGTHLLQKPFTAESLARKVRDVLDAS